ncbi:uncharacterized protein [Scyliorhinus torazame]
MFINKIKEQLMAEKSCGQTASPQNQQTEQQQQQQQQLQQVQSYSHALITSGTISGVTQTPSIDVKECGQTQPMVTENVTVLPLPSTALMTGLVITSPSASLSSSSSGLSPLIHPPTFSLAGTPTMIVSGLPPGLSGQTVPSLSGLEKKVPEEAQGPGHPPHPAQDEGPNKPPGTRKRKVRPSEPTLAELADPYAVPNDDDGGKDGKSYRCRICPLTFLSKSEMQIHAKSHTESKPHHCPHCSKTFANTSYLAQHIRIHSGAKPYNCSYCQKSFRQLSHLQQHTRIHTGDRPYKCVQPGCDKSFTQLSNLQSHRRQHNKDKPFKCQHCHRAYTDSPSLQVHLATHTVKHIKAYACNSCRKSYTSETYLMKHMRKHKAPEQGPDPFGATCGCAGSTRGRSPSVLSISWRSSLTRTRTPCLTVSGERTPG